jgi:hypothetical protein
MLLHEEDETVKGEKPELEKDTLEDGLNMPIL